MTVRRDVDGPGPGGEPVDGRAPSFRQGWQVLPLEGTFEFGYLDENGARSLRRLAAHELRIGAGKTLLGGTDLRLGAYRGFRADRIGALKDLESGERIERSILDWLIRRALRQERERRRGEAAAARAALPPSRSGAVAG